MIATFKSKPGEHKTGIFTFIALWLIGKYFAAIMKQQKDMEEKVKYFRPTIKQGWFGEIVSWEMRDKPLK